MAVKGLRSGVRGAWFGLAAIAFVLFLSQLDTGPRFLLSVGLGLAYATEKFTDSTLRPAAFWGLTSLLGFGAFAFLGMEIVQRAWHGGGEGAVAPEATILGLALGVIGAVLFSLRVARPASRIADMRGRILVVMVVFTVVMLVAADILLLV